MLNIAFAMKAPCIFLRAEFRNSRTDYIFQEILGRRLLLDFIPVGINDPVPEGAFCLHYGIPGGDITIPASGILSETAENNWTLRPDPEIQVLVRDKLEFSDDLFGAAFFLLSRYKEQFSEEPRDHHGRFPDEAHFTDPIIREIPLVEIWVQRLRLKLQFLGISVPEQKTFSTFSIDWDNPTAYLHKNIARQAAGIAADLLKGKTSKVAERLMVLAGKKPDPYDTLGKHIDIELLRGKRIFFWLGDYGKHDKGLSWKNRWYRNRIRELSGNMIPGLHPSYACFERPEKIGEEKKRLEEILDREITASRFHFLRFRLPESYRLLEEAGIREDFSMGFSAFPGFRAGTSIPFRWFDLKINQAGNLLIHPFSLMDSSTAFRDGHSQVFLDAASRQLESGKKYGFPVHALFHNEHPGWPGWSRLIHDYCSL